MKPKYFLENKSSILTAKQYNKLSSLQISWVTKRTLTHKFIYKIMSLFAKKKALDFNDWLMTNCTLSEDGTIWSYEGEDYTNEKLYKIFLKR